MRRSSLPNEDIQALVAENGVPRRSEISGAVFESYERGARGGKQRCSVAPKRPEMSSNHTDHGRGSMAK